MQVILLLIRVSILQVLETREERKIRSINMSIRLRTLLVWSLIVLLLSLSPIYMASLVHLTSMTPHLMNALADGVTPVR